MDKKCLLTWRTKRLIIVVLFMTIIFIPDGFAASGTEKIPKSGGVMKIAVDGEPSGLDCTLTTATLTTSIAWHIFENLFTFGDKMEVIPMLVKNCTIGDKGLTYTLDLREGILFHNGEEMDADDVMASITRWGKIASSGKTTVANFGSMEKTGKYRVVIKLKEPDALLLANLAIEAAGPVIIPKEIAEKAGVQPIKEYIGTGPYKFVEWKSNQHIKLARFEGYKPLDGKPNGYGGRKVAYIDELVFVFVPDQTVQSAGVEAGDFDYAYAVNSEEYERLKSTPGVQAVVSPPRGWLGFIINNKQGIMSNKKIRQAMLACLDMEPILVISRGHRDMWRMDPSINQKETIWWSDEGKELYNQKNPEKAKRLLAEAGYKGETIRWQVSYDSYYNAALVAKSQLEAIGMKVELIKYESATETSRRRDPKLWDLSVTGYTVKADPTLNTFLKSSSPGWWENAEVDDLFEKLRFETDFDKRYAMVARIQELFYEDVPYIKVGDYASFRLLHKRVKNFANLPNIFFWNVSLEG
jgi:peptide/nickel transport system substrate-binding protein